MSYIPTIVIDDDNEEVLRNFRLKSEKNGVQVVTFQTWDKTKEYLVLPNSKVDGVILDARGKLNANESPGEEHLFESFSWVRSSQIPYAIYTAYTDELPMLKQQIAEGRVFTKGKHKEEDIFNFLKKEISKTPKIKLINKYSVAYEVYNKKIIGSNYEHMLIEMLFCLENKNYKKKNLNVIRDLLESIYLTLINEYECIPETFVNQNNKPNLEWCTRYLEGKPTNDAGGKSFNLEMEIPYYISTSFRYIKEISNSYSHLSENAIVKTSFISAAYSALEILEWLPSFIENNFEY